MTVVTGRVSDSLARIESALGNLWLDDDSKAGVRAYTLNLVAVSGHSGLDDFVTDVDDISARLSARTCIVTVDPKAVPWSLEGDVSAVCRVTQGGAPKVCAERIELRFGAMTTKRARSVVEALAESRLPVVLYAGPGAHAYVVDDLLAACDRVVIDSGDVGVERAAEIAAATDAVVEDLSFLHIRNWRELVARFFDPPDLAPALRRIRRVSVTHAPGDDPGGAAHAELLVAWIGSRLGWTARDGRLFDAAGEAVEVELGAVDRHDVKASRLDSVTIVADHDGGELTGRLCRGEQPGHLIWSLDAEGHSGGERSFAVTRRSDIDLVCRAAEEVLLAPVTQAALELAAAWRGKP